MHRFTSIVFMAAAVIGVRCTGASIDTERTAAAITAVLEKQASAWNRGDVGEFMNGYWESEDLTFASGGTFERGWKRVLERYKIKYTPESMGRLTFSNLEITVLSRDAAFVLGAWDLQREPDNPGGVFTLILRKLPSGWKIVHDHTSSRK